MERKEILVVDDEKNIRLTMAQSLEPLGMPVRTAVNGEDALFSWSLNPRQSGRQRKSAMVKGKKDSLSSSWAAVA